MALLALLSGWLALLTLAVAINACTTCPCQRTRGRGARVSETSAEDPRDASDSDTGYGIKRQGRY